MTNAVEVQGLVKTYNKGEIKALKGLDLVVPAGQVLGVLGPNGSGKTTAVSILSTLLIPDAGQGVVAGYDLLKEPNKVRESIGLSGQFAAVDEILTGFENLHMFARLYGMNNAEATSRAHELLEMFNLTDAGNRPAKGYSGGMRRRLDVAGALVARPRVIFLDEPTTGLDPQSRLGLWKTIRQLVADGASLLLTTQYLEEADHLADSIVVIDHGEEIAAGTADELKSQLGGDRIELTLEPGQSIEQAKSILVEHAIGEVQVDQTENSLLAPVAGGTKTLTKVLNELEAQGLGTVDAGLRRPTLDDVFLSLTGHTAEGDAAEADEAAEAANETEVA